MSLGWRDDILPHYQARDLVLPDADLAPGEPADPLVATLVRRSGRRHRKAVLYLHGWNDYFFQTHLGDFFARLGYDFYALDLRRYGRSMREGLLPGYITDLSQYVTEIDAAVSVIQADHRRDRLVVTGHSTGGLIAALWAADRPDSADGLILNSPWLDLQGSAMIRRIGTPVVEALAGRGLSTTAIPMPANDLYARSLRADRAGEWEYDLTLKGSPGPPILIGWLRAIRQGHSRVATGLGIEAPILVMASAKTVYRRRWHPDLMTADAVLDVEQIAGRAPKLGRHVTIARFAGGLHDLVLSPQPVRDQVFAEMEAWIGGYLR